MVAPAPSESMFFLERLLQHICVLQILLRLMHTAVHAEPALAMRCATQAKTSVNADYLRCMVMYLVHLIGLQSPRPWRLTLDMPSRLSAQRVPVNLRRFHNGTGRHSAAS